jgi:hypothetical protein
MHLCFIRNKLDYPDGYSNAFVGNFEHANQDLHAHELPGELPHPGFIPK